MLDFCYKALVKPFLDALRGALNAALLVSIAGLVAAALFAPVYLLVDMPPIAQVALGVVCLLLGVAGAKNALGSEVSHRPLRGRPLARERKGE